MTDYNSEYMNYKRCFKCQRETEGVEDFQSISKNGKIRTCKTCKKCRGSVKTSLMKHREPTIKEKYETTKKILLLLNETHNDKLNDIIDNIEGEEKNILLKIIS